MQKKPNILIFMTDHQRRETMPGYGWCRMPTLERFAQECMQFDNAVCSAPHCCPSRASFFTGLYPSEHGVWNNVEVESALSRGLARGVRLWSEDLRDSGYRLFYSGKWHVSSEEGPQDRGFEVLYGDEHYTGIRRADATRVSDGCDWKRYVPGRMSDPAAPRREGEIQRPGYPRYFLYGENAHPYHDREVVDAAARRLRARPTGGEAPWCMFVGVKGPHDPYQAPAEYLSLYDADRLTLPESFYDDMRDKPALYRRTRRRYAQLSEREHREALRHYLAFCSYEDALFGQVLSALRDSGEYENTVIVFLADHGDYCGAHGLWAKGLPCFREAYSIPLMIRLPGGQTGRSDYPACITDVAPTLLELCGIPANRRMQGQSLAAILRGTGAPAPRPYRFTQTNGNEIYGIQRSVFSDRWKYVYNSFDEDELYDLQNDPLEMRNLAAEPGHEEIIRTLCREMWRFARENRDTIVNPYIMTALAPYGPGILLEETQA